MRFPIFFVFSAIWALAIWAGAAFAQGSPPAPDAAPSTPVETAALPSFEPTREEAVLEAFIDGVVEAHRRQHGAPGVVVSVVKDGRVLFAKGYGDADAASGAPADGEETLFRIGSISKTFVWTAAMMLADRGVIDLDADVNEYLRDVRIPEAFDAPVTMNDLMAHRAGFEDAFGVYTRADDGTISFADALNEDMPARVFPSGARSSYSNWGSALAARVVEDAAGVPYETFLNEEILAPLGMGATTLKGPVVMPEELRARLSTGHKVEFGRGVETDYMQIGPFAPAGAMASTAADMARWMLLHLGGGEYDGARLMSPRAHDLMWSRNFNDRATGADMAHGFMDRPYRGTTVYSHAGGVAGFLSNMAMAPELGVGVFVSQNAADDFGLGLELPDLIIDRLLGDRAAAPVGGETVAFEAADYLGAYFLNRRSFTRFEKFLAMSGVASVSADDKGGLLLSSNAEAVRFDPVGGDVFEDAHGNRIAFGRNEQGDVTHMTDAMGVHSYERVGVFSGPGMMNIVFGAALLFSVTTWLGAWRRQGRPVEHGALGVNLNRFALLAATVFFIFTIVSTIALIRLTTTSAADLVDYPFTSVILTQAAGYVVFAAGALTVVSLFPAWAMSGWGLWRKIHHTLFAAALGALAVMLVVWNIVFSATA